MFNTTGRTFSLIIILALITPAVICSTAETGLSQSRRRTAKSHRAQRPRDLDKAHIMQAEQKLSSLGYWTGKVNGVLDAGSRSALIAFQKLHHMDRTGRLTQADFDAIQNASPPVPRVKGFPHVEVDLDNQVLFFVSAEGQVSRILPISSGSAKEFTSEGYTRRAITPIGSFKVYDKIQGWRKSPLGLLYYPSYIVGGIAIHGNPSVPVHAASHGCIRIPMFASIEFYDLAAIGTAVLVYGDNGAAAAGERSLGKPPQLFNPGASQSPGKSNPDKPM